MNNPPIAQVFLSYTPENQEAVEALARRLRGDGRLDFWFAPWHSVPGVPMQEQMEDALLQAQSCAVFVGGGAQGVAGWQHEQMRAAIQTRVEDDRGYRIIPVLLPGTIRPNKRDLPPFLRRYEPVEFHAPDDEGAFRRLLAGILGIAPVQVEGYLDTEERKGRLPLPASSFAHGHALVIGVANYPHVPPLPDTVLNDARDLREVLTKPASCGYPEANIRVLLDDGASADGIRTALAELAARTGPDDTVVIFFSGHGAYSGVGDGQQYLLPYDCNPADLDRTAIGGDEFTALLRNIKARRLLVLLDCCHSGGAAEPKALFTFKTGLSEDYYAALAQGVGRVVIASSRPDELSWAMGGMRNSLFSHYLLEALRGRARTLGDGYVRVFDLFRHVADQVPTRANQHPIFKAASMETDFAVALVSTK